MENKAIASDVINYGKELAIQFTLEMDLDDDSELRHFIGED
jgi:hypothetical protein